MIQCGCRGSFDGTLVRFMMLMRGRFFRGVDKSAMGAAGGRHGHAHASGSEPGLQRGRRDPGAKHPRAFGGERPSQHEGGVVMRRSWYHEGLAPLPM